MSTQPQARRAGATPEVLSGHLSYIKAINSGDLEGALAFIESERAALARADVPGRDRRQLPMRRQRGDRVFCGEAQQDAALHMADTVADVRTVLDGRMRTARHMRRLHAPETLHE